MHALCRHRTRPGRTLPGRTLPGRTLPGRTLPGRTLPGRSPFGLVPALAIVPALGLVAALAIGLGGCSHELEGPDPVPERLEPDGECGDEQPQIVCSEQLVTPVRVCGEGLSPLVIDTLIGEDQVVLPELTLQRVSGVTGDPGSGNPVTLDASGVTWSSQQGMSFDVTPELGLAPGVYDLTVENANGSEGLLSEALVVVPPPSLDSVEPQLFCSEQISAVLTLRGSGFVELEDGTLPTVTVGGVDRQPDAVADCQDLAGPAGGRTCNELVVTIPPDSLAPGVHYVFVTNPAPAGCVSTEAVQVEVVPPPEVTEVIPDPVCTEQFTQQVTVLGSGFLVVGTDLPIVTIGGTDYPADSAQDCTPLTVVPDSRSCTALTVTLPMGVLSPGDHDVVVTNPEPAPCTSGAPYVLTVVPPPTVDSVDPASICTGGGEFTIYGSGFYDGATVEVGGATPITTNVIDDGTIDVTMGFSLSPGTYDVTVTNLDGCADTLAGAITVIPGPIVFFVDPPRLYNGISIRVTIYASGLTGTPLSVQLIHTGTSNVVSITDFTWDAAQPGRILATVPAGLDPGTYDVVVEDPSGCPAILSAGVTVVDTLTVALDSMAPPFGWVNTATAVEIRAVDPPPTGQVQFQATPRAYLNPTNPGPNTVASPLLSVSFVGDPAQPSALLTALVPDGLPVGTYDLIVVNPDGSVGQLAGAFEVVADAPPSIFTISPGSSPNNVDTPGTIYGDSFRNPTVEMTCRDPNNVETTYTVTVSGSTGTTIDVTFPTNGVAEGSVCVITVTNDDGTYATFSALAVTNPSENLAPWSAAPAMSTARRAPVALAGRATQTARYLHAIGGDDGTAAGAMTSVESAQVDLFGNVQAWFEQPYALPAPSTLAGGVRIGRFFYLVGGNDGTSAVDTVYRAEILDPLDAPVVDDLSITTGSGAGLGGGIWYYRVSAVFGSGDDRNPDGESLASEPLVVQLPDLTDKIHLTLLWSQVPGAVGYRVYRSPQPDLASGSEELIAEVSGGATTQLTDTGLASLTPVIAPLPNGALGQWRALTSAPLNSAREGFGIALAADPGQSSNPDLGSAFYIYAIGGRDDTGTVLSSYEYLPVSVNSPKSHTVGTWTSGTIDLPSARWQLGAYVLNAQSSTSVPTGETWIYAGGGRGSGAAIVTEVSAVEVQTGGALDAGGWESVTGFTPGRAGYGYAGINNRLFAFGGNQGNPSNESMSAHVCPFAGCGLRTFPDTAGFNNEGTNMSVDRVLMGSTLESAFIFIVGGQSSTGPTNTVDSTIW